MSAQSRGRRCVTTAIRPGRRAMVMLIVVVVLMLAALAGYGAVLRLQTEHKAARFRGDQLQADLAADAAVARLADVMRRSPRERRAGGGVFDNPDLFFGVGLDSPFDVTTGLGGEGAANLGPGFSVLAWPAPEAWVVPTLGRDASPLGDTATDRLRFGVDHECAKLDLNQLLAWEQLQPGIGRYALTQFPGVDDSLADAILDWIDADDTPRDFGAESDYYLALPHPYRAANRPLASLSELLLVRGVTPDWLLGPQAGDLLSFAAEWNAEPGVADLAASAAGETPRGGTSDETSTPAIAWFTVHSACRNETLEGAKRWDVNAVDLVALHQGLSEALGVEWANFIVLYRQYGPASGADSARAASEIAVDLNRPASHRIATVLDLLTAHAKAPGDSESSVVASPLARSKELWLTEGPRVLDALATSPAPTQFGVVDWSVADKRVVASLPGVDAALLQRVLAIREEPSARTGERSDSYEVLMRLLVDGAMPLEKARTVFPSLTNRGDVVRCFVVGYAGPSGPTAIREVVLDAATPTPMVRACVDWRDGAPTWAVRARPSPKATGDSDAASALSPVEEGPTS